MPVQTPQLEEPIFGQGGTQQQAAAMTAPMPTGTPAPQQLPAGAGFVSKAGAGAYVANSIINGWLKGRQIAAVRNMQTAQNEISTSFQSYKNDAEKYQQLVLGGADKQKVEEARAVAMLAWNRYNQTRAKYVIPEKSDGKQPKSKGDQFKGALGHWAGEMFGKSGVQPHLIAEMAIKSAMNNPEGLEPSVQEMQQAEEGRNSLIIQGQTITRNKHQELVDAYNFEQTQKEDERQNDLASVLAFEGGADGVLLAAKNGKLDTPNKAGMVAAAWRLKNTADPAVQMTRQLWDKYQVYQEAKKKDPNTPLSAEDRIMFGEAKFMPAIQQPKVFRNGRNWQLYIDPVTGQSLLDAHGKPMQVDLGTPDDLALHYQERAEKRQDLINAISENPDKFGIPAGLDPQAKKNLVNSIADWMQAAQNNKLMFAAASRGLRPFEASRENSAVLGIATEMAKELKRQPTIYITGVGPQTAEQVRKDFQQFFVDSADGDGRWQIRDTPAIPEGQKPEVTAALQAWAKKRFINQLITHKGPDGKPYSPEDAEEIANQTPLGKPIGSANQAQSGGDNGGFWAKFLPPKPGEKKADEGEKSDGSAWDDYPAVATGNLMGKLWKAEGDLIGKELSPTPRDMTHSGPNGAYGPVTKTSKVWEVFQDGHWERYNLEKDEAEAMQNNGWDVRPERKGA